MDRPMTRRELEVSILRACAPTLLGAKPASMFTFCGPFATRCPGCEEVPCAEAPPIPASAEHARRRVAFTRLLAGLDGELAAVGARATVLAWRPFGAIVYVYRPALLAHQLVEHRCAADLAALGYPPAEAAGNEDALRLQLARLRSRFHQVNVPHEIGYFLGYPVEDVRGFIAHEGRGYLCCGCWKVYADVRRAQRLFGRYKRCTRRALMLAAGGATLTELARLPRRRARHSLTVSQAGAGPASDRKDKV